MNSSYRDGADEMEWCIFRLFQNTNSPHDRLLELVLVLVICCIVELLKVNIRPRAVFAIYIIFEVIINNHAISCYIRLSIFSPCLHKKRIWAKWMIIAILYFSIYHVFDIKNVKIVLLCNVWVLAKRWIPAKVLTNRKVWTSSLANRKPAGLVPWPMRGVSWSLSQECFLAA